MLSFLLLAYNYSVENQTLTEALNKQQSRMHHIYSTIAGKKADLKTPLLPADEIKNREFSNICRAELDGIPTYFSSQSLFIVFSTSHHNGQ